MWQFQNVQGIHRGGVRGLWRALILGIQVLFPVVALSECLIPPTFDPGIGGIYYCDPAEGERHLIALARRGHTETGLSEDIWVNFRGIFHDRIWINVGLQEASDASLPAWDALATLIEWIRAIKAGDAKALEAFLSPLELNAVYTEADRALQERLLQALRDAATLPQNAPLRVVLYHVHLMPPPELKDQIRVPLNPLLSIPSQEDLLYAPHLLMLAPLAESKIAVPAGIWTYSWDPEQANRFVAKYYTGPVEAPFALKFGHVYTRFAVNEYVKQGLNDPAAMTPERLRHYVETLRSTGAILHFAFATDWAAIQQGRAEE